MSTSKEQANFTRLSRLLINIGTQVLKDQFDAIHPPSSLHSVLTSTANHGLLKTLKARRIINVHQWHKLYPSVSGSVSSANFDITLLFLLLRNICGFSPPTSAVSSGSWDKLPAAADTSKEADLVRIKYFRNTIYGHITETATTDADFEQLWSGIEGVFLRLNSKSGNRPGLQADVQRLKVDSIDPDEAEYCNSILEDWENRDKTVMGEMKETKEIAIETKEVAREVKEAALETKEAVIKTEQSVMDKLMATNENVIQIKNLIRKPTELDELQIPTKKLKQPDFTAEDADRYCKMLKSSMISQTVNMPNYNSHLMAKMKTDEIFTSILVKHRQDTAERNRQNLSKGLTAPYEIQSCSEIFLHKDCHDSNGNRPKKMLISGQAGIGKTLFCHKLVRDWSKGELFFNDPTTNHPDLKFTFLLTFRQINEIKKDINLSELLNLSSLLDSKSMTNDTIIEYFVQHPEQVFIVFDGLDESSNTNDIHSVFESGFPNDVREKMAAAVLCSKLIKGKLLKDSVVIITSRPRNAADIENQIPFDSYLEITGFNEGNVLEYVERYFKFNLGTKVKVLAIFKANKILLSFAKVPLLCFFACLYLGWHVDQSTDVLPNSLTDFYAIVIEHIEKNHNRLVLKAKCPPVIDTLLDKLSEVAYDLIICQKHSFDECYLRSKLNLSAEDIAYIKSSNLLCCVIGVKQSPFDDMKYEYSFLHLTIQEFLAAYHLLRTNKGVPLSIYLSDELLQFVSGLARKYGKEKFMHDVILYYNKQNFDIRSPVTSEAIKCLNAYGDKELVKQTIIKNECNVRGCCFGGKSSLLVLSIDDLGCTGIALVLDCTSELISENAILGQDCPICLDISFRSSLTSYGIKILCNSLMNDYCPINNLRFWDGLDGDSVTCLIRYLPQCTKIDSLSLYWDKTGDHVIPFGISNSVKKLTLSNNNLTDESALGIIRHFPVAYSLNLSGNPLLTDKCLDDILHSGIIELYLHGDRNITDEGAETILRKCPEIKTLHLGGYNLSEEGIATMVQKWTGVSSLSLYRCKFMTNKIAISIARSCKQLEEVDLSGTNIKYDGILEIVKECNRLAHLVFVDNLLSPKEMDDLRQWCKIRKIELYA